MQFKKYMHIERLGNLEVEGILEGDCYIFPKIDGTNASVWLGDNEEICAGSRNRELTLDNDNAGFLKYIQTHKGIKEFFILNPELILYGEWLVPHSLKTYREDTWRNFYIFDVRLEDGSYLDYEKYLSYAHDYEIEVIPPIRVILNPTVEDVVKVIDKNIYLIKDGEGVGEGVILKNYSFVNKYGKTIWAKVVRNEFKDQNAKAFGTKESKGTDIIEDKIVSEMFSKELIDKVIANIKNECGWNSKSIPRLIETVWHDFVIENIWDIVKKHKTPTINFKLLKQFVVQKIKETVPELF